MALVTAATEKFSNKTPVGLMYTSMGTVVYDGTSSIVHLHEVGSRFRLTRPSFTAHCNCLQSSRCSSITEDDAFDDWDGLKKPLPKVSVRYSFYALTPVCPR